MQKQTHREWNLWLWVSRRMGGRDIIREFEIMYTLLYLKWITNKDLLYSTGNSAQCYVAAWLEGSLEENEYMYIYIKAESLYRSPETIITLLIGYTPIQSKKLNNAICPPLTSEYVKVLNIDPISVYPLYANLPSYWVFSHDYVCCWLPGMRIPSACKVFLHSLICLLIL